MIAKFSSRRKLAFGIACVILFSFERDLFSQVPATPEKIYGELFRQVQLQAILPDEKTFADAVPNRPPAVILRAYGSMKDTAGLQNLIKTYFFLPGIVTDSGFGYSPGDLLVSNTWKKLQVKASGRRPSSGSHGNSLLPLPSAYIVPGGNARELEYSESYFILLGLKEAGNLSMVKSMVNDFAYLVQKYGHIPAGNRSYYLTRSGPPFFCLMVELLAGMAGDGVYKTYLPAMEAEYAYWMAGAAAAKSGTMSKHVVVLEDGSVLNRFWDEGSGPRAEHYKEDHELAEAAATDLAMRIRATSAEALKRVLDQKRNSVYAQLRAAAESGWQQSSRWLVDTANAATVQAANLVPVDLNCLLYLSEKVLAKATAFLNRDAAAAYLQKATNRKAAILKYCWNDATGFFYDYNAVSHQQENAITAAGIYPLFAGIATPEQANKSEAVVRGTLLKDGGLLTSTVSSKNPHDAPFGTAAIQWVAVNGLVHYGKKRIAIDIAKRWTVLNTKVKSSSGRFIGKYNVADTSLNAQHAAYDEKEPFAGTLGVFLALQNMHLLDAAH